jgi:phage recombination protein Bet
MEAVDRDTGEVVALVPAARPLISYTPAQLDLIKRTLVPGATNDELELLLYQSKRTGLDLLARQMYGIKRAGRMTIQTSIDGFRLIAERSGHYAGQLGPFWCGEDGVWHDVWLLQTPPVAARVAVLRHDFKEPCWGVARYAAYAQPSNSIWRTMADNQLAKCAEALALRKGFPQELSGLYTNDEMAQADVGQEPRDVTPSESPIEARTAPERPQPTQSYPSRQQAAPPPSDAQADARKRYNEIAAEIDASMTVPDLERLVAAPAWAAMAEVVRRVEGDARTDELLAKLERRVAKRSADLLGGSLEGFAK